MPTTAPPIFPFDPVPHARNRPHKVRGTDVIGRWRHDEGKKVLIPLWPLLPSSSSSPPPHTPSTLLTSFAGFCLWTLAQNWRHSRQSHCLRKRRQHRRCLSQMTASAAVYAVAVTQLFAVLLVHLCRNECSTCVRFATQINVLSVSLCMFIFAIIVNILLRARARGTPMFQSSSSSSSNSRSITRGDNCPLCSRLWCMFCWESETGDSKGALRSGGVDGPGSGGGSIHIPRARHLLSCNAVVKCLDTSFGNFKPQTHI